MDFKFYIFFLGFKTQVFNFQFLTQPDISFPRFPNFWPEKGYFLVYFNRSIAIGSSRDLMNTRFCDQALPVTTMVSVVKSRIPLNLKNISMPLYTLHEERSTYYNLCMKLYVNDEKINIGCWAHHAGNALARVKRVHAPTDLWDITFCTRWF